MTPFDFHPTVRVIYGAGSIDRLGELAKDLGAVQVLLVTDPGIAAAGHVERAIDALRRAGLQRFIFDGVAENPTTRHVIAGTDYARETGNIDLIVGLGGGSAMDCAKGINFLLTNGGRMEDYWGVGKARKPMLPSIGVPTTAGTGSEGQSFALISREDTHQKMACGDIKARFRTVILDPELASSVPDEVATVTGMDAISHALESYVCTRRNAMSQLFARQAWHLLNRHFEIVLQDRNNIEAWGQMLLGAHLAGMAIENSMLGAAHALANPLTARFGLTHGNAVGLMLPHVIHFNQETVGPLYDELCAAAGMPVSAPARGGQQLIARLTEIQQQTGLPSRLASRQIPRTVLPDLARDAATQWTGTFNPRQVTEAQFLALYEAAY